MHPFDYIQFEHLLFTLLHVVYLFVCLFLCLFVCLFAYPVFGFCSLFIVLRTERNGEMMNPKICKQCFPCT